MNAAGPAVSIGVALLACEKCCDGTLLRRKSFGHSDMSVPALDGGSVG
jgi:hypothetical protein